MASVLFYEKPGCVGNARQKQLLAAAGHSVRVRDLLTEDWTAERLRRFFGDLPVALWFNASAPRVRNGEVDCQGLGEAEALRLMLADPLLIRRPLLEVDGECRAGFDTAGIEAWIGLAGLATADDLESCPKDQPAEPCDTSAEKLASDSR